VPAPSEQRFRLRGDVLAESRRPLDRRFGLTVVAAAALVVLAFAAGLRGGGPGGSGTLVLGFGILLLLALWSWRRRTAAFLARWRGFEVVLEPSAIVRLAHGQPPVRIAREEVASVGEAPEGLVVRARGGAVVVAPRELEGYEALRAALAAWAPPGAPTAG
jgi:hypothetical protein